jgi:hypothetical protein
MCKKISFGKNLRDHLKGLYNEWEVNIKNDSFKEIGHEDVNWIHLL